MSLVRFVWPAVRRLALLTVLLATVFAAVSLLPGDAATATSERGESATDLAARRAALGLDRPLAERFWDWLAGLPTGDLGTSAHGRPVTALLAAPFPNTLLLGGLALLLSVTGALALGSWAALRPGGRVDRAVATAATAAFALPEFVVSVALLLVLSLWTGWLPAVTLTGPDGAPASWRMLVLPLLALTIPQIGWNTRIVRGALADQASLPHVQAAILDGLPRHRVLTHHVLPGALPAIAVGTATSAGMLLGGAVVVETLFNYPGIGAVLAGAVADRDTPLVAGVVAATGAAISTLLLAADLIRDRTLGVRA
ncbi:ABC transporter permease [Kitasatospora sp. MAP5-34]|uniref:ABC transporter permease n=1 Tax=Kitasatospora sp. MAP5-34 TaxID=3035102 RepID=UPI0024763CCB|nr:ABC transporter permease [Kitasatospora sp. MAP5-34]MDH6577268.1 peptide/nickel transport system permease protein [Kitasatospora sp. MAP5-34]